MGYYYEDLGFVQGAFTNCDELPALKSIPPVEYYAGVGIRSSQEMELPSNLPTGLRRILGFRRPCRESF